MPDAHDPDISGLNRVLGPFDRRVFAAQNADEVVTVGDTYECPGGVSIVTPPVFCPGLGAGDYSDSFTIPDHWSGPFADELYPPPDFALVEVEVGFELFPYTRFCRGGVDTDCDRDYWCATPAIAEEAEISVGLDSAAGAGAADWHPAGIAGWAPRAYDPGRDPAYFDSFDPGCDVGPSWLQRGFALLAPPATAYSDPDPLDPALPYVPFLWRWRDILGATLTISAASLTGWHALTQAGASGWELHVRPYWYIAPPVTSPTGTVYWL